MSIIDKASQAAGKVIGEKGQRLVAVAGAKAEKVLPTVLVVTGVVGIVGAGVMACRATLKVESVVDAAKDDLEKIHEHESTYCTPEDQPEKDRAIRKEKTIVYLNTGLELAKLYAPSIALGAASITMILESHHIMQQRNAALIGAYEMVSAGFKEYRERVKEKYGEDVDRDMRFGLVQETVEVEKEDAAGRMRKSKQEIRAFDPNQISRYAVIFDENSTQWESNPEYNKAFVIGIQNTCNDMLHANGYLFLNTVYSMLGLPETSEGQLVGWMMGKGDDFVDFGIYDDAYSREAKHKFINGCEPSIILDFNVDGVIYKEI